MWCSFLPPYLLSRLAGAEAERGGLSASARTLVLDDELRFGRMTAPPTMRQPAVRAAGGTSAGKSSAGFSMMETRVVHDAHSTLQLPGEAVRSDDDPAIGDAAADEAFAAAGQVWDLFVTAFSRRSVDGNATTLSVTVHYGEDYVNAFWDGAQLVFGDGDGVTFRRFTTLDVLAHEFTHGVTEHTAGLSYQGQPGALNESVSDVFATLARQRSLAQRVDRADWLIGADVFAPGVSARGLRSMTDPGTAYDDPRLGRDPQVGSMADYVDTEEDNGGVHINSGIPNRAFATAALAIGGHSWEHAGQVWYDALTSGEVGADTDFARFARATVGSAERLFPGDARIATSVRAAWITVGVDAADSHPASQPAPAAPSPELVAVSRSGGFTGMTRFAELDLDTDPQGPEVRDLLGSMDLGALTSSPGGADRFVYTVQYGSASVTLGEQDLTPELHRVVKLVLGSRPARPPAPGG